MALAHGMRSPLNDSQAKVRDKQNGTARQVSSGDIGVLCRTNRVCSKVVLALRSMNIRAALPGSGLLDTPEMQSGMAEIRLWVDHRSCQLIVKWIP
jgi:ATP-dependent exoDNAse (exonuclease V) beta subunit